MKRVDLQKLCKDYGVKANLKSEALIDLLLDTQSAIMSTKHTTSSLAHSIPSSSRRSVSTTRQSNHAGGSRTTSVIIHETDDEVEHDHKPACVKNEGAPSRETHSFNRPSMQPQSSIPTAGLATRVRKAKELQRRLGVGKPVAAGGTGARVVTRSTSSSRGQHNKPSRMFQREATIPEEGSEEPGFERIVGLPSQGNGGKSTIDSPTKADASSVQSSLALLADIDQRVADAIRPLHEQLQTLRSELEQMYSLKSELAQLKVEMEGMKMAHETGPLTSSSAIIANLSTPKPIHVKKTMGPGGLGMPSVVRPPVANHEVQKSGFNHGGSSALASNAAFHHYEQQPIALGKRPRDSLDEPFKASSIIGAEDTIPERKKIKLIHPDIQESEEKDNSNDLSEDPDILTKEVDEIGNRQPSIHFSDFLTIPSPPGTVSAPEHALHNHGAAVRAASPSDRRNTFAFTFHPVITTPGPQLHPHRYTQYNMTGFPYFEQPESPTPSGSGGLNIAAHGPSSGGFTRSDENQTDVFKSFGLPASSRPTGRPSSATNSTSLGDTNKESDVTSNEVAARLGLRAISSSSSSSVTLGPAESEDAPPMRVTMYGTELDGDTRFGDFGVDGVATGFWTGVRF
ncbi:hypothetical protein AMATHDRAFT_52241 [Amanita thiersii Skay4041]|uniref:Uncharacterized protein n=1 Tax=Amanita thiersii Skay4041 TaxID=703135 RepID=A0A2A9P1P6_9AGAR|nr:hypothetical protein AMATHDRAFT_52241 [Amanita thiersii Skay4041]